ncbi:DUF4178 domain-containing protein [Micromonospora sp. KC723]|uniref:DUF4178 domain-containing protein n=1 Tax=Micromonospora sp. KC723 TaxID=2530381 RepID=UPI00104FE710|nr:DUF4178 domain-containing protein [Micromonospora sp. KC723]TDB73714.1 DUF4178 domain-containing protein [Micromonospora sp. KC723]
MNGSVAWLVTVVGCLVGIAGVGVAVVTRDRRRRPERPGPLRGGDVDDARRLKPGDVVEIRRVSYPIRGSVHLIEGAWSWAEHLLDTADGDKRWLSVEVDRDLELVLWAAEPSATVAPGAPTIDYAGRRYAWEESGQARYSATGSVGLEPRGTVRYHDYRARDGARLAFEAYGESGWEVARGERLHRSEVTVHPQGDPEKVD